ncbi:zinc finger protein 433 isoform X2 [Bombyx mori]|nr:zinc finger protein 433 isoform X2 [Bombyx mori]XP_037869326.1 zinc finger protein 433 isoform X2 [Bombyx mori]
MLSLRDDDDDDKHLCIKCNATIVGLDSYIKHRKDKCGKAKVNKRPDLPPIDTLDPSCSLGADIFFQSLELQSSVKKTSLTPPVPTTKPSDSKNAPSTSSQRVSPLDSRGEHWIGGHSLTTDTSVDNHTKLINAVASISGSVKKDVSFDLYDESDDSEGSEDDDDDEHASGQKWKPPPNYTGGKWRPTSPDQAWNPNDGEQTGKWKSDLPDRDEDDETPPPGHTKGKWVPGANEKTQIMQPIIQSKGSIQYWCGPCNRRLGSRAVYDKHLKSSLHIKKVLPERELEYSGHLKPIKPKRTIRPSRFVNDGIYTRTQRKKTKSTKVSVKIQLKKRKRKTTFIRCIGCDSRVRRHLMGKHLISHYHFRKTTAVDSEVYQKLILDNIVAIVHQSPFQCNPCKFYTNWLSNFMQHWFTEEHQEKTNLIEGRFWCSFCKFECETSQEMLDHLSSPTHSEAVAVVNRSMPIIIRKKTIFKCETCSMEFKYNIEMKKHSIKTSHPLAYTGTDDYQEFHRCQHCKVKFKSSLTLAAHLKRKHKQKAYFCLVCMKTFNTSLEAKIHRQTSEHRIKSRENRIRLKGGSTKDLNKKCPYCTEKVVLRNILMLKEHIRIVHPDIRKKCPKCGMTFIFSQEVTRHIRSEACKFQPSASNASIFWNCSKCLFTTDSQAECFFHEVLHTEPVKETKIIKGVEKIFQKYTCPLCPKSFKKASLRQHLRQHTFERPFVCGTCGANFTRQTTLVNHQKNEHGTTGKMPRVPIVERIEDPDIDWECEKCGNNFNSRSALTRHVAVDCTELSRSGAMLQCPHEECTYVANTISKLARHRRTHGERIKHHECPLCSFKTDQASHFKRHMLCHRGIKPYGCPYCQFTCGSLENLRKHVLRSGRHKGLCLYKCHICNYPTNMATNLREHLRTVHSDKYDSKTATESVRTHLMVNKSIE